MVGPISRERRAATAFRVKLGFVLLVGASAGLMTLVGDPSPLAIAVAVLGGLVVGTLLVWYVFPGTGEVRSLRERGQD